LTRTNFFFLAKGHDPLFLQLAETAERALATDPNTTLLKLRQLGEAFAKHAAAAAGVWTGPQVSQADLLRELDRKGYLDRQVLDFFHTLRRVGNGAAHDFTGSRSQALDNLRIARQLAIWFHRTFGPPGARELKPGPFVPPPDPTEHLRNLETQLATMRAQLESTRQDAAAARELAQLEAQRRAEEEALRRRAEEDRAAAEELINEAQHEAQRKLSEAEQRFQEQLKSVQAQAAQQSQSVLDAQKSLSLEVSADLDLDEEDTRALIDAQLRAAGWEADSVNLRYAQGARPEAGKSRAIAEWPTRKGPADYVFFVGLTPLAIAEAKRKSKNVSASVSQSKRYSVGFKPEAGLTLPRPSGAPEDFAGWDSGEADAGKPVRLRVPFLFATNGRSYHRQYGLESGIWFLDGRSPINLPRPLEAWYSPAGLQRLLELDVAGAHARLHQEPTHYLGLRDYQLRAIQAVEQTLEKGERTCLVAMATGTGKTRTTIGLLYRLIKAERFRCVLFLVDRTSLGDQATDAFKEMRLEQAKTFNDIYDLRELGDAKPTEQTRVQVATVQAMVKRLFRPEDGEEAPPVDQYDCIVVDESHRGYTLDKQLNEGEETYRDFRDYLSTYRRVLDYFDAVKIGLTATPALHTREIFGDPVFSYSYREAVADGFLVDHEPPIRYITRLAQEGIKFPKGSNVEVSVGAGQRDFWKLEDELHFEVDAFNRTVITEGFNRVVCAELAKDLDPHLDEKTLIFCANDEHADLVVHLLKQAFQARYTDVPNAAVLKITGATDDVKVAISRFKNERWPNVAVTVDLLTTGIDVPPIANLVFLRRVRSRILYEQMLGRATRLCTYADGTEKAVFRVYDAVDLYAALEAVTDMKPLVKELDVPASQLIDEVLDPKAQAVAGADSGTTQADERLAQLAERLRRRVRRSHSPRAKVSEEFKKAVERIETLTGVELAQLPNMLRREGVASFASRLQKHPELRPALEMLLAPAQVLASPRYIAPGEDVLIAREREYPYGKKPEDYLESFRTFVKTNLNLIPALNLVVSKPSGLTRKQLKELRLKLEDHGFGEKTLENAIAEVQGTNVTIAASIMGLIRQQALGSPLKPYSQRVDAALQKVLTSRAWTASQRKWLEKFALQLKHEQVLDREALDSGPFKQSGGFAHIDKAFEGQVLDVLSELQQQVWTDAA
jgi:type I restriction enzyme R subunit